MPCHLLIQISQRPPGDRLGNWPAELEPVSLRCTKTSCCFFFNSLCKISPKRWWWISKFRAATRRLRVWGFLGFLVDSIWFWNAVFVPGKTALFPFFSATFWLRSLKKHRAANLKVLSITVQHCCSIYFYFLSQFKDQESFGEELRGFSVRNGAWNHNETIIDWLHILGGFVIFKKLFAFGPFLVICRVFRSSSLNPNQP